MKKREKKKRKRNLCSLTFQDKKDQSCEIYLYKDSVKGTINKVKLLTTTKGENMAHTYSRRLSH